MGPLPQLSAKLDTILISVAEFSSLSQSSSVHSGSGNLLTLKTQNNLREKGSTASDSECVIRREIVVPLGMLSAFVSLRKKEANHF